MGFVFLYYSPFGIFTEEMVAGAALGDDVQRRVDLVAVGHGVVEVESAGLERVGPGRVFGLGDDDLLDARLLALEVARVVRVDGQGRLQGALVEREPFWPIR